MNRSTKSRAALESVQRIMLLGMTTKVTKSVLEDTYYYEKISHEEIKVVISNNGNTPQRSKARFFGQLNKNSCNSRCVFNHLKAHVDVILVVAVIAAPVHVASFPLKRENGHENVSQ